MHCINKWLPKRIILKLNKVELELCQLEANPYGLVLGDYKPPEKYVYSNFTSFVPHFLFLLGKPRRKTFGSTAIINFNYLKSCLRLLRDTGTRTELLLHLNLLF